MPNPRKMWKRAKFRVIGVRIIDARATWRFARNARPHRSETIPMIGNRYPFALTAEMKAQPLGVNISGVFTAEGRRPNFDAKMMMKKIPARMRMVL
ncbi:hypothetical protein CMI46_00260 [Candidatus Pacearchaeota archaeon]|nr:hypothetical protein [Candidatus Pacearchaeota archaeon]